MPANELSSRALIATVAAKTERRLLGVFLAAYPLLACSLETASEDVASAQSDVKILGDVANKPIPLPRPPVDPEQLIQITAGSSHSCVRKWNGNVYCWGRDDRGQVGRQPNATCRSAPDGCVDRPRLVASTSGLTTAAQVDAGAQHTCAIDPTGKAYCWGDGDRGELGLGVGRGLGIGGWQFEPLPVAGGLAFTGVSAGTQSTCGTTSSGIFCWGLPIPSSPPPPSTFAPALIYGATGVAPTGISVGMQHVCAQWVSGAYRETNCWGRNDAGQTGATISPSSQLGQGPNVGSAALRVTTQATFTCVDQPGPSVMCFGEGSSGQLGSGVLGRTATPQIVGGVTPMALSGVTTGQFHACALDPNGYAYCWGGGNWGQLGNGLLPDRSAKGSPLPVPVTGGLRFRAIAAGELHTCAIGVDNGIYCWGSNYFGQLGTQYKSQGTVTDGWVADPVRALDPT